MRDFEADRRICDAATPGPWKIGKQGQCVVANSTVGTHCDKGTAEYYGGNLVCESTHTENAAFIAAARDGWPKALDRIAELENELLQKTQQVDELLQETQRLELMLVFVGTGFDVCSGCKWLGDDKICDRGIMPMGNPCRKQGFISWELR